MAIFDIEVRDALKNNSIHFENIQDEIESDLIFGQKTDHLLIQQNKKLLKFQEVQNDY